LANILVVEDDPGIARLLEVTLTLAGHRVRVAQRVRSALDIIAERWPEAVTLDLNLAGEDGGIVVVEARRLGLPTRFLVVAAFGAAAAAAQLGAQAWLDKPFDPLSVERKISAMLGSLSPA
jgi:DNA-binding response OmpR family regulator